MILLFLIGNAFAIPGKLEFIASYPEEDIHFIHNGKNIVVLQFKKSQANKLERVLDVKCTVEKLTNGQAIVGKNKIVFYENYAKINNKKRFFYQTQKTDLLFYRDMCKL
jgi:hypothetical protein